MSRKINVTLKFNEDLGAYLKNKFPGISDYRVISKSLDARKSNRGKTPTFHYILEILNKGERFQEFKEKLSKIPSFPSRPIIIGAGPAGLFCALRLLEYGVPSTIIERGGRAEERMKSISKGPMPRITKSMSLKSLTFCATG